jgi:hypothetical protein
MKTDYDWFSFNYEEPEKNLTLDEAIARAKVLRSADKTRIYRVVPIDSDHSAFRVEAVSQERVYADFLTRASKWASKFLTHLTAR